MNKRPWQLPSYVTSVPTGEERGQFLAVDLGGSNCRICLVELHGDTTFTAVRSKHTVPAEARVNAGYRPVFAFIAERLAEFLEAHVYPRSGRDFEDQRYSLGFTFSFTCTQTSLAQGTLIRWDKGWNIPDAVSRDPCAMLQEAIDMLGLPVDVSVLANDSVGTLLTRAYTSGRDGQTLGAVIFGTGTNAAYVEKLSNVRRTADTGETGVMVMNTEWGSFDDKLEVLTTTRYDRELDANSIDPGSQMVEKRASGMYLGELFRLALLRLYARCSLNMHVHHDSCLFQHGGIDSSLLSRLASEDGSSIDKARIIITETLAAENISLADIKSIQTLAAAIVRRAARLAGASMAAIVIQSGRLETTRTTTKLNMITEERDYRQHEPQRSLTRRFHGFSARVLLLLRKILTAIGVKLLTSFSWPPAPLRIVPSGTDDDPDGGVIDFGADGSLIESYPTFEADMRVALREIPEIGPAGERRIQIGLAKDGSGVGAALMAQAAAQNRNLKCDSGSA